MDFHLAVVAAQLRRAAEDLESRYAGTPQTLARVRTGIAAACLGLAGAGRAELPAELLPGFLRAERRDTWTSR